MLETQLKKRIAEALHTLYGVETDEEQLKLEQTNKDFEGDYTFVVFPFLRLSKKSPEQTATALGEYLQQHAELISGFNVVKGFLNLIVNETYWIEFLNRDWNKADFGRLNTGAGRRIMVEYSSPNTNKPLHLGHIRNNLLGYSLCRILEHNGYEVIKVNLINDRGIHICKSMLAWQKFGNGETPESSGLKGDHLVGKYYVIFDREYKKEIDALIAQGIEKEKAEKEAPLMQAAQQMLRDWEAGNEEIRSLWKQMNDWVYTGFESTYRRLGVEFDRFYYESDTYLLGKNLVEEGLKSGVYFRKEDGSVWCDLTDLGLDEKLLLRGDGTSVYITQDLGTAQLKYDDYAMERSIYVVGNEQDYHFKVLQLLLQKLGKPYAGGIYHMSYGMVDLPQGKMKSREGTVVDADDLMDEMHQTALERTTELGKTEGMSEAQLNELYEMLGQGALKYFILRVDPQKRMLFNPQESIDFQGDTGPFIQYTHARMRSILRNAAEIPLESGFQDLNPEEKALLSVLHDFPAAVAQAARDLSPSTIAHYAHELARAYNRFYHEWPILHEPSPQKRALRLKLTAFSASVIKDACDLLGIKVPERM